MKNNDLSAVIQRHPANPLLTAKDVSYPCSLLFNAGVTKFQGRYVMVFRNDYGAENGADFLARQAADQPHFDGTNLGIAFSQDGVAWSVEPRPCIDLEKARQLVTPLIPGKDPEKNLKRFYDPRLTVIDGRVYMCFAIDTEYGLRGGIAVTDDFEKWKVLSASVPDNRNMALFPEKVGGRYVRFERPINTNGGYSFGGDQAMMWMSFSPDMKYWGDSRHLLRTQDIPFCNDKMGPGAPPIKTRAGWLTTFHAVWRDNSRGKNGWEAQWPKIYRAGLMLLDIDDPSRIIGFCADPLLEPEEIGRAHV